MTFACGEDKELVHVDAVPNGLACNCRCAACGARLVAKQGHETAHHFAHEGGSGCPGALETSLHLAAKTILMRERRMALPDVVAVAEAPDVQGVLHSATRTLKSKAVMFDEVRAEVRRGRVIPDIVASVQGKTLLVEIAVTHFADEAKKAVLRDQGTAAVEVDLSAAGVDWNWKTLAHAVVEATENKVWLFNARIDALTEAARADAGVKARQADKAEAARRERIEQSHEMQRHSIPGFAEAYQRLKVLMEPADLAAEQARLDAEGPGLGAWQSAARMLNIQWEATPEYLNVSVPNELGLSVARQVWQASLFALFVRGKRSKSFSGRTVQRWCMDTFGYRNGFSVLQNQRHLLTEAELAVVPWAARAVRNYLDELVKRGFLSSTDERYEIVKGSAGRRGAGNP